MSFKFVNYTPVGFTSASLDQHSYDLPKSNFFIEEFNLF